MTGYSAPESAAFISFLKVKYDSSLNIIHARPYDTLSIREIGDYFNSITKDKDVRKGIIEVVHFMNVDEWP